MYMLRCGRLWSSGWTSYVRTRYAKYNVVYGVSVRIRSTRGSQSSHPWACKYDHVHGVYVCVVK